MTTLTLYRLHQDEHATFGQIEDAERNVLCVTLERPWVDANHDGLSDPNVSCIPSGSFTATRYHSPHFGYDVFSLSGVPGRGNIELHRGNTVHDSKGCILLGTRIGDVNGERGITGSAQAFERFMDRMAGVNTFTLTVVDVPATEG